MKKYQVVSIGDVVIDELLLIGSENVHSRLHSNNSEVCFRYGQKIIVDRCEFFIGGNAYNVAVGLSRAGLSVGLCTEIGDDEFSQRIINSLSEEHVDTQLVKQIKGAKTSFTVAIHFQHYRTLFVDHVERQHDFTLDEIDTEWIYLTNLRKHWETPFKNILAFLAIHNTKLAFNPGTSQLKEGYKSLAEILRHTSLLFLNKEEAEQLIESYTNEKINPSQPQTMKDLLQIIQSMGPEVIVISDGERGSFMMAEQGQYISSEVLPGKVLDTTGAGDAYAAGFLSALINKKTLQEAMQFGAINATSTIEHPGPQIGLLSWEALNSRYTESNR